MRLHAGHQPDRVGEDGKIYNCNADVAAAQAAIALKARRLVFMSDVPGLLRDPKKPTQSFRTCKPARWMVSKNPAD